MLKIKLWCAEEDMIIKYMAEQSDNQINWVSIVQKLNRAGYKKTVVQCKERYNNSLRSNIDKSKWTQAESIRLFELFKTHGTQWREIAHSLCGRTYNAVKNQFYSLVRKGIRTINKFMGLKYSRNEINNIRTALIAKFMLNEIGNQDNTRLIEKFVFTPIVILFKEVKDDEKANVLRAFKLLIDSCSDYIKYGKNLSTYLDGKASNQTTCKSTRSKNTVSASHLLSKTNIKELTEVEISANTLIKKVQTRLNYKTERLTDLFNKINEQSNKKSHFDTDCFDQFFSTLIDLSAVIRYELTNQIKSDDPLEKNTSERTFVTYMVKNNNIVSERIHSEYENDNFYNSLPINSNHIEEKNKFYEDYAKRDVDRLNFIVANKGDKSDGSSKRFKMCIQGFSPILNSGSWDNNIYSENIDESFILDDDLLAKRNLSNNESMF